MVAHDTRSSFFGLSLECLNDKTLSPYLFFSFFVWRKKQRKDVVPMETFNGWQCLCFYEWINPLRWLIHPLIKGVIVNNYFRSKSATNTSFIGSHYCSFLCCLMLWATWGVWLPRRPPPATTGLLVRTVSQEKNLFIVSEDCDIVW